MVLITEKDTITFPPLTQVWQLHRRKIWDSGHLAELWLDGLHYLLQSIYIVAGSLDQGNKYVLSG